MGGTGLRKRFALDTNLIFDLAEQKDFAFTFIEVFQEKGYDLLLPPTAAQELAFAYAIGTARTCRERVELPFGVADKGI